MPKIFALRHQLAEQQARLKQQAKFNSDVIDVDGSSPAPAPGPALPHSSSSRASTYPQQQPLDLGRQGKDLGSNHQTTEKHAYVLKMTLLDYQRETVHKHFGFLMERLYPEPAIVLSNVSFCFKEVQTTKKCCYFPFGASGSGSVKNQMRDCTLGWLHPCMRMCV